MKTTIRLSVTSQAIILMLVLSVSAYSQGTDSRMVSSGGNKFIGLSIDPVTTTINNEGFSPAGLKVKGAMSVNITAEAGKFFSDFIGVSIGIGYGSYSTKLNLDSASYRFTATDSDNEQFEMRIKGKTITEDQKLSLVSIPVTMIIRYPLNDKISFYLKPGLSFSIPLAKTYNGTGIFTYDGYYAEYPVLLHDLPQFNFPNNYNNKVTDDLVVKSFNMALVASAGITFSVNDNISILAAGTFSKGLGSISGYEADSNFRLSEKADDMKSIMAGCTNAGLQAFGASIGIRYYLR
ncbi:MAG TPA: outer membrane beta-barrel protein [Bacteroidales bacterium]|nr:outer membrane beta-barrel protein [Bacteroidales bacterium]